MYPQPNVLINTFQLRLNSLGSVAKIIAVATLLQACAPISQFPQNSPPPSSSSKPSSSSPPPSSGLPTPPSPSSGLPSPPSTGAPSIPGQPSPPGQPPGIPSPAGAPGQPSPPSQQSELPAPPGTPGDPSSGSEESTRTGEDPGWLEDIGDNAGEDWQTSNEKGDEGTSSDQASSAGDTASDRPKNGKSAAENELEGALEDFDGEILAERGALKKAADKYPTPVSTSLPQGSEQGGPNADAAKQPASTQIPNNPPPPRRSNETLPDDIPDAKDDDIIARQLREAALQESDPELKEKLWAEYQRYKQG